MVWELKIWQSMILYNVGQQLNEVQAVADVFKGIH